MRTAGAATVEARLRRFGLFALGLTLVALLASAMKGTGTALPPGLLLLLPYCSAVALVGGFRWGNAAFGAALIILAWYFGTHAPGAPRDAAVRGNLIIALVTTQVFVWMFAASYRRCKLVLRSQEAIVRARVEEQARLTQTLVVDFKRALADMRVSLIGALSADALRVLRTRQESIVAALTEARRALTPAPTVEATPDLPLDFRAHMMRWILLITAGEMVLVLVRSKVFALGPALPAIVLLTASLALFAAFARWPQRRPVIAAVFALACWGVTIWALFPWGFALPPPGTVFLLTIAYHAVLIGWRPSAVVLALANVAALGYVLARGAGDTPYGMAFVLCILVGVLAMQVSWQLFQKLVARSLDRAQHRAEELARLEVFRTRLCGTLFHDVANLAQGLGMLLAFDELPASERPLFERLLLRLDGLVDAAARALEIEGPTAETQLEPVLVDDLFTAMQELFDFRLKEKSLSLKYESSGQLKVRAQPELLRDSVLANLLSNAIKFSPPGNVIELRAEQGARGVEISVRDHGCGWPEELPRLLDTGQKIASREGSAGEAGLGLGLTLAREHLRRMGGELTLRSPRGGGSEAAVALPCA